MTSTKWVAAWANAMSIAEHRPEAYAKNITLRYPILAPFDATKIRLTFDNFCGTEPITISHATVSRSAGGSNIDPSSVCDITFSGSASTMILATGNVVSDAIAFSVTAGETLAISFYLSDFTQMQSAVYVSGPLSQSYFATGDHVAESFPMEQTKTNDWVYFLSEVDFLTDSSNHALVCYGDSITAQNWPDELALLAYANPNNHTAIVRRAASGCRILRQYSCLKYDSYGLKADIRFPHEFPMPGADSMIIQEGINDIIHPVGVESNPFRPWEDMPTLTDLETGLLYCIDQAHSHGMKAYLGTLLPIYGWRTYAPFRDELRMQLNEWMRSCKEADGCIDFDLAVHNPNNPIAFDDGCDSGDHLHPSALGYKKMAQAVPKNLY